MTDPKDRLIVAYDFPDTETALAFDGQMGDAILWVKVGLELFIAEGPPMIRELTRRGRRVFLDLKLHDIPRTAAGAVHSASKHGAKLLTLHAEGGPQMMRAAVEARDAAGADTQIVGVTVLTSLDGSEYPEVYASRDVGQRVRVLAGAAAEAGLDGIVCSPQELDAVRDLPGEFLRITPGVRPAGSARDDQARVTTPETAIRAGASRLVVGRPITTAPDPLQAARAVLEEISGVLQGQEPV